MGVESIHYPFKQPLSVNGLTWGSTSRSLSLSIDSVEKKTMHKNWEVGRGEGGGSDVRGG